MSEAESLCSVLVRLLANPSLELPQIALIADVVAADARFNDWMAVEGKRDLSDDAMLEAIDVYEDTRNECLTAIEGFESSASFDGLETVLRKALETLRKGIPA